ncbi:hypothetical protein HGA11_30055 [Mycolicibacterium septicum DSM 44393]|uniref:Uncharacterized protein n=1 Tax=Mycolicibacterium septicum DSM 44393 TaxID=1341646 RepID=A0A7X6MYB6_9MYCO|nr:hypothetical protein [Mycolicibacterium septicum]NKZ15224.1 hypothetical protein [Mycolicibacterium septicum DSM 44393]
MRSIEDEIQRVNERSRKMLGAYLEWYDKIEFADTYNTMYSDIIDYANFRFETADSCLDLIDRRKIADALGLERSLLEHYLLLMLLCRGHKYFQLENLETKTPQEFAEYFERQKVALAEQQKTSEAGPLYIAKYPRAARHLMHVFEGLRGEGDGGEGISIPYHFFQFQEFHPESMRLNDKDYFEYYEPGPDIRKVQKDRRRETAALYRHYLSYDALLQNLELNELADKTVRARIEAHYTFLGKFLHPTHQAARNLHVRSNFLSGRTAIGMEEEYTGSAILLAALYVCFCLAGILNEIAALFEAAPQMYIHDAGTGDIRGLAASVPLDFPYFWFLYNAPPLYDKFNYAVHHVDDKDLDEWGGFEGVPNELVSFDYNIYRQLDSAIGGWSNTRVGRYKSPLDDDG